jgi:hypothetical protein
MAGALQSAIDRPLAPLPASLAMRHGDELACGAGVVLQSAVESAACRAATPSSYECIEGTYDRPMIAPSLD